MRKSYIFLLAILFGLLASFSQIPEAEADTSTFYATSSDGDISASSMTYSTAHNAISGAELDVTSNTMVVGQDYYAPLLTYYVYRGFLFFDTSTIPESATILDANLTISIENYQNSTNFNITLQNGQPTYPHEPIVLGDFYMNKYSGNGGMLDTTSISTDTPYDINITQHSWITKEGTTKLALRSSRDIDYTTPSSKEYLFIYTSEESNSTLRPQLSIEWKRYSFTLRGLYNEDTGNFLTTGVNVTAYFSDGTSQETFLVNGSYSYSTNNMLTHFVFNLTSSNNVVSQYGLNTLVYNQSSYYDIVFYQYEVDTDYTVEVTLTWNSTYTVTNKATTGCRINFGTKPMEDEYMNWYVQRTITTASQPREYWVGPTESHTTIYIFEGTTTVYTFAFLDLAGALDDYPFVEAQRYVNGTLQTVEKRRVDEEKKIQMSLINGVKYSLIIKDGSSYTFGDLLMTSTESVTLTLRGIDFPKETLLTYKYVRVYGLRAFGVNATVYGNITITYDDTLSMTNSVQIFINYRNGTNAYNTTETADSFIHVWSSANNTYDYQVTVTIDHQRYGVYTWKQYFPRTYTDNPWASLAFLGTLPFGLSDLIGIMLVVLIGGGFSQVNPEIGAFFATVTAAALTYIGFMAVAPGALIAAITFSIMLALVMKKRRVAYR